MAVGSRPFPVGRGSHPISIVMAYPGPIERPVFGEQVHVGSASARPEADLASLNLNDCF